MHNLSIVIIICGLILRLILATINVEYGIFTNAVPDSLKFHEEGLKFLNYLKYKDIFQLDYEFDIGWVYGSFLGLSYFYITDTFLFGSYLSCFFWFFSALIFRSIIIKFQTNELAINISTLCYCFLFPLSIIYSCLTLREVYMLFLFNTFLYLSLKIEYNKSFIKKIFYILLIIVVVSALAVMHNANLALFVLLVPTTFLFILIKKNIIKIDLLNFIIFTTFLIILFHFNIFEKVFDQIINYQKGHFLKTDFDRTDYTSLQDRKNLNYNFQNLIIIMLKNFFNYNFQPTILNISKIQDLFLFYENILRVFLILICFKKIKNLKHKKNTFQLFFIIFFLMEFLYAQATVNWGTASRHHLPVLGILIIISFLKTDKSRMS